MIPSDCTGASSSFCDLFVIGAPVEFDGAPSARGAGTSPTPASEVAHIRQTDDPGLFQASHFGQTIILDSALTRRSLYVNAILVQNGKKGQNFECRISNIELRSFMKSEILLKAEILLKSEILP